MIDPFALVVNRPNAVTETRTFKTTWQGQEIEVPFTLRGLDDADGYVVQDAAFAYASKYDPKNEETFVPITLGGRPIPMSFQLCNAAARILTAQEGPGYTFEQICAWVVILGGGWGDVLAFADELDAKVKAQGKAPATV